MKNSYLGYLFEKLVNYCKNNSEKLKILILIFSYWFSGWFLINYIYFNSYYPTYSVQAKICLTIGLLIVIPGVILTFFYAYNIVNKNYESYKKLKKCEQKCILYKTCPFFDKDSYTCINSGGNYCGFFHEYTHSES
jgi:hypothetical protein